MNWFQGPFDDHAVLLGLQVFWWKRILSAGQILFGTIVLTSLLTEQHKVALNARLKDWQKNAASVRVPPVLRVRTVLKWMLLAVLTIAIPLSAWLAATGAMPGHPAGSFFKLVALFTVLLMLVLVPILPLSISVSAMYSMIRSGQKHIPPLLAWVFDHQRFDRSLVVINFVLFLVASAAQLYLS